MRALLVWLIVCVAAGASLALAALSPLLQWRDPVYVVAGFGGVVALVLMLFQPLLAAGLLPGIAVSFGRKIHRVVGVLLVAAVVVHVSGLWITSPPDVVDVLLFRSPAPFSIWGAVAMWAVFAAAVLAVFRRHIFLRTWRLAHTSFMTLAVLGTVIHALLIEGTMEPFSKLAVCCLALATLAVSLWRLRFWTSLKLHR